MYVCLDCGRIFESPVHYTERHGLSSPPYEEFEGCPYCGGAYVEAIYCDGCGNPILGDYVEIVNGGKYCENCFTTKNICN